MFRFLFALSLITAVSGCGQPGLPGDDLQGTWKSPLVMSNGIGFELFLTFKADTVNATSVCSGGAEKMTAAATVPVTYTETTFTTTAAASKKVTQNGFNCSVNMAAGTITYTVKADTLSITSDGQTSTLTRSSPPPVTNN